MNTKLVLVALCVLALLACITINVYFPEAAIKDLAEQIEEQVEQQAAEETAEEAPEETPEDGTTAPAPEARLGSGDILLCLLSLGASTAWAAEDEEVPAPEVSNPAIRKIIDSRAARLKALVAAKERGVIGENNQALIEVRDLEPVEGLKERADLQRLVKAENADREQLYREIAAAKNVDLSQLPRIRQTYAETLREKARSGDWIQLPDGTWKQK